jgi:hypothetical protein
VDAGGVLCSFDGAIRRLAVRDSAATDRLGTAAEGFRAVGGATPARVGSRRSWRGCRSGGGATRGPIEVARVAMAPAQDGAGAAVGGGELPKTGAERPRRYPSG